MFLDYFIDRPITFEMKGFLKYKTQMKILNITDGIQNPELITYLISLNKNYDIYIPKQTCQ